MKTNYAIGIIVLVVLVIAAFFIGSHFNAAPAPATSTTTPSGTATTSDYYQDVSSWQTYRDDSAGFSIAYPLDFQTDEPPSPATSTDWRLDADGNPGTLSFTLTIPSTFEPQTNFADAKLTVGESGNGSAVADCLTPDPSGNPDSGAAMPRTINGAEFSVFDFSGAGAGNLYDTTSYRALRGGTCYAIEYTIHSTQLANYPASYNLQQFDETKVRAVLERIVGTFTFL